MIGAHSLKSRMHPLSTPSFTSDYEGSILENTIYDQLDFDSKRNICSAGRKYGHNYLVLGKRKGVRHGYIEGNLKNSCAWT